MDAAEHISWDAARESEHNKALRGELIQERPLSWCKELLPHHQILSEHRLDEQEFILYLLFHPFDQLRCPVF